MVERSIGAMNLIESVGVRRERCWTVIGTVRSVDVMSRVMGCVFAMTRGCLLHELLTRDHQYHPVTQEPVTDSGDDRTWCGDPGVARPRESCGSGSAVWSGSSQSGP